MLGRADDAQRIGREEQGRQDRGERHQQDQHGADQGAPVAREAGDEFEARELEARHHRISIRGSSHM